MRIDLPGDYEKALRGAAGTALRDGFRRVAEEFVRRHSDELAEALRREMVQAVVRAASVTGEADTMKRESSLVFRLEVRDEA